MGILMVKIKPKRNGGTAKKGHRGKPVTDGDVYFQPEVASQMFDILLQRHGLPHPPFEESNGVRTYPEIRVLDACANDGVLGRALAGKIPGAVLTLQDIKTAGISFLDESFGIRKFDYIVCNPPWKEQIAKPIYHRCLELLSPSGVLFFVINNVFMYQGRDRAVAIRCHKYYFLPRYIFKKSGRSLLDCGVAVHHNGVTQMPVDSMSFLDIAR